MDTNNVTTFLGGIAGIDMLWAAIQKLIAAPSVENGGHVVAALFMIGWAYFTNKK